MTASDSISPRAPRLSGTFRSVFQSARAPRGGESRGLVRITTVTRLEVGYSARSGQDARTMFVHPPLSAMPVEYLTAAIEDRADRGATAPRGTGAAPGALHPGRAHRRHHRAPHGVTARHAATPIAGRQTTRTPAPCAVRQSSTAGAADDPSTAQHAPGTGPQRPLGGARRRAARRGCPRHEGAASLGRPPRHGLVDSRREHATAASILGGAEVTGDDEHPHLRLPIASGPSVESPAAISEQDGSMDPTWSIVDPIDGSRTGVRVAQPAGEAPWRSLM